MEERVSKQERVRLRNLAAETSIEQHDFCRFDHAVHISAFLEEPEFLGKCKLPHHVKGVIVVRHQGPQESRSPRTF